MKKLMTLFLTLILFFTCFNVVNAEGEQQGEKPPIEFTVAGDREDQQSNVCINNMHLIVNYTDDLKGKEVSYTKEIKFGNTSIISETGKLTLPSDTGFYSLDFTGVNDSNDGGATISYKVTYDEKEYTSTTTLKIDENKLGYGQPLIQVGDYKFIDYDLAIAYNNTLSTKSNYKLLKYTQIESSLSGTFDLNGYTLVFMLPSVDSSEGKNALYTIIDSSTLANGHIVFGNDGKTKRVTSALFTSDVSKYLEDHLDIVKEGKYYRVFKDVGDVNVTENVAAIQNTVALNAKTVGGSVNASNIKTVDVKLESDPNVDSSIKSKVENKADGDVSKYLDLTLTATDSFNNNGEITELSSEATVTFLLDEDTNNLLKGKDVTVIREHDGDVEEIEATYDEDNKVLAIKSDKFSTFAIVTSDKAQESETSNDPYANVKWTEANTPCEEWNHSKNWTWSESQQKCIYRVTNTSSK